MPQKRAVSALGCAKGIARLRAAKRKDRCVAVRKVSSGKAGGGAASQIPPGRPALPPNITTPSTTRRASAWRTLRAGQLSRHQVAMLWLIHSEGEGGRQMDRKAIERSLETWFGSRAPPSQGARAMALPPLELVRLIEDPKSGREKIVVLTPKGEAHMKKMIAGGEAYVQRIIDHMTDEEIVRGLHFFKRISEIVEGFRQD